MTDNSKTPPANKTIEDPPEYGAAAGESNSWSGRGKPPEQPGGGTEAAPSEAVPSEAPHVASGGIGGEREATYQQNGQSAVNDRGRVPADDVTAQVGWAPEPHSGPIESAVRGGAYWATDLANRNEDPPTFLLSDHSASIYAEPFVITTGLLPNNCVTVTSPRWNKYVRWTDDGEIVLSDIDSSIEWDGIWPDDQNYLRFSYSEPVFGCFRLQIADQRTVKYIYDLEQNFLLALPQVDDFSLFKKTWE
ncbi:hypothetical protein ACU8MI_01365 [Rhizobium leguminosarum]